jgi:hypothetical protein
MSKAMLVGVLLLLIIGVGYIGYVEMNTKKVAPVDAVPQAMTLSGTYVCLPHIDTTGPQTEECSFGLQGDSGEYYAVNFGASAEAMQQFQSGANITAQGFFVPKEAMSTNEWAKYNMKGMFTITKIMSVGTLVPQGKIDINAVCDGALAYMTFPDGAAADKFVAECKEGKHPEVIERFKQQLGVDGAAI